MIIQKCHRLVLCSRQHPYSPVFIMKARITVYKGHAILAASHSVAALETHYIRTWAEKQSSWLAPASTVCTGLLAELRFFHTSCHCVTICSRSKISCDRLVVLSCGNVSPFPFWAHCVSISALRLALHGATSVVRLFGFKRPNELTKIISFCQMIFICLVLFLKRNKRSSEIQQKCSFSPRASEWAGRCDKQLGRWAQRDDVNKFALMTVEYKQRTGSVLLAVVLNNKEHTF